MQWSKKVGFVCQLNLCIQCTDWIKIDFGVHAVLNWLTRNMYIHTVDKKVRMRAVQILSAVGSEAIHCAWTNVMNEKSV